MDDNGLEGNEDLDEMYFKRVLVGAGGHTGSNLAIAGEAVNRIGGTIIPSNITDKEGGVLGARFTVQLPLDPEKMNWKDSRELAVEIENKMGIDVYDENGNLKE